MALNELTRITNTGISSTVQLGGTKTMVIGVRVGTAVTFSVPGDTFAVVGRSGNITVNL